MKKAYLLLSVFVLAILFNACQQEEFTQGFNENPTPAYDLIPIDPEEEVYDRTSIDAIINYMDPVFAEWHSQMVNSGESGYKPIAIQGKIIIEMPRKEPGFRRGHCIMAETYCLIVYPTPRNAVVSTLSSIYGYNPNAPEGFTDFVILAWADAPELVQGGVTNLLFNSNDEVDHFMMHDEFGGKVADWTDAEWNIKEF